ncbi:DUF1499 domain-containing protein [Phreatobacter sp.]|uniref:DUF1499 domain-containing protein n=1 Tax=Phreatobacter sp. TaxID=1966341 RepID=UPI003F7255A4
MRRHVLIEPTSRLAVWSLRLTVVGIGVALVALLAARTDRLDGAQAAAALAAGLGVTAAGVVAAALAGMLIWFSGYRGARYAVAAMLLGLATLAYPVASLAIGIGHPALNDITTDPADPPAFDIAASARPATANPVAYPAAFAPLQRRLYPEIRPLEIDLPPEDVNEIIAELVAGRGWRVLDRLDYRGPDREGRFEMVHRSLIMGFRDDIVIRVRAVDGRARIDMRSAARYGRQDFGVNARRVVAALDDLRVAARRAQRQQ